MEEVQLKDVKPMEDIEEDTKEDEEEGGGEEESVYRYNRTKDHVVRYGNMIKTCGCIIGPDCSII